MELGAPLNVVTDGILNFSLPEGHLLTADNLNQLAAHHAEFLFIREPDPRSEEQVALDAAVAEQRVMRIFAKADFSEPAAVALFNQILRYRST